VNGRRLAALLFFNTKAGLAKKEHENALTGTRCRDDCAADVVR